MIVRPRIGVTCWEDVPGERLEDYYRRIREAGGEPVDLSVEPVTDRETRCVDPLAGAAALVLTGGIDIDPAIYGETPHARVKRTDRVRDEFELTLLRQALARDLPVLAICRGHQLLNVAFGGSLLQHIDGDGHRADFKTEGIPSRWHDATVCQGTLLHRALGLPAGQAGATDVHVNSRHHQAVTPDRLAPGLRAVAFSPDGAIVEGMESTRHRWVVGVQWHPERGEMGAASDPLFAALIAACRK